MKPLEMGRDDASFLRGSRRRLGHQRGILRMVDLFSGAGGLTLGVEEAARLQGLATDVRLAVEIDARIGSVYAENFGVAPARLQRDVTKCFDRRPRSPLSETERAFARLVGEVDVLVGGPPCQGHSTLNNHTRGDDPKNALYLSMVRAAEVLEPGLVLIENVPAVERDRGQVVQRARALLERLGYNVDTAIVSMADIGVPQLRHRHVLVGTKERAAVLRGAIAAATVNCHRDLAWAIGDLRGVVRTKLDEPSVLTRENLKRAQYLLASGDYDLPNRLRPVCQRGEHKYKSMYGRLRWDAPAQTITTGFGSPGQGRYLHPEEPRTLTPHEAARIQFFPDWFRIEDLPRKALARAIGNAVPPKLSFVIAASFLTLAVANSARSTAGLQPSLARDAERSRALRTTTRTGEAVGLGT